MRVDKGNRKLIHLMALLLAGFALTACGLLSSSEPLPTQVPAPTEDPNSPIFAAPTLPPAWTQAPVAGAVVVCSCEANLFNCADFGSRQEAQACYDFCGGANNDVHLLDQDLNGISCETYTW